MFWRPKEGLVQASSLDLAPASDDGPDCVHLFELLTDKWGSQHSSFYRLLRAKRWSRVSWKGPLFFARTAQNTEKYLALALSGGLSRPVSCASDQHTSGRWERDLGSLFASSRPTRAGKLVTFEGCPYSRNATPSETYVKISVVRCAIVCFSLHISMLSKGIDAYRMRMHPCAGGELRFSTIPKGHIPTQPRLCKPRVGPRRNAESFATYGKARSSSLVDGRSWRGVAR
jgi:hypothetical protein